MTASDYEVTDEDVERWSDRVQDEDSRQSFENAATSDNGDKWADNASDSGDAYAQGVADYIGSDASDIGVADEYEDGCQDNGDAWTNGLSGTSDRWANGVEGAEDAYREGTEGAGQEWFSNYVEGVEEE